MVCKSTRVRIARYLVRSTTRPRVGLERDGALYDVEALEDALGAAIEVPGDAWDFHTRVVALGLAGLRELDAALLQGRRPASALVDRGAGVAALAPCDTERAAYVQVDVRAQQPLIRLGAARALAGQDALVALPRGESAPAVEVSLAVVLGEDLRDATVAEARHAILGYAVLVEWCARELERSARPHETVKGLRASLGPELVAAAALPKIASQRASVAVGGKTYDLGAVADLGAAPEEAVALASRALDLQAGDVVAVGPFAPSLDLRVGFHDKVHAAVERVGTLRGAAVPRR